MTKRERKKRLKNRFTKEALQRLNDRLLRTRGFKSDLEGAIEYSAWKILACMESRVEKEGISISDVLYPAVESVAKSIIYQLKSKN